MSREVIGDAPDLAAPEPQRFATALRASRQALLPPGAVTELKPPRLARRHTAALAAAVLVTSATVTFAASRPPADPARGVVAAVTGATAAVAPAGDAGHRVLLTIAIANPGSESVRVDGYAPTTRSSAATPVDRPTAHVGASETVEITVDVNLRCTAAAAPSLPRLVLAEEDGGRRAVTAVGAVSAFTDLCAEGPLTGHSLVSTGSHREGTDLLVDVASPAGRRTAIRRIEAAGVQLDAGELPVGVGRRPVTLRLRPPTACPSAWRQDGIPTRLDVEVDTGGPAAVRVVVGPELARWALDVGCGSP